MPWRRRRLELTDGTGWLRAEVIVELPSGHSDQAAVRAVVVSGSALLPVSPGLRPSRVDVPPVALREAVRVAGVEAAGPCTAVMVDSQHSAEVLLTVSHPNLSAQVLTELCRFRECQRNIESSVDFLLLFGETDLLPL